MIRDRCTSERRSLAGGAAPKNESVVLVVVDNQNAQGRQVLIHIGARVGRFRAPPWGSGSMNSPGNLPSSLQHRPASLQDFHLSPNLRQLTAFGMKNASGTVTERKRTDSVPDAFSWLFLAAPTDPDGPRVPGRPLWSRWVTSRRFAKLGRMEPKKRSTSDLALAISLTAGGVIGLIVFWQMGIAFRSRAMRWEAIIGGAARCRHRL